MYNFNIIILNDTGSKHLQTPAKNIFYIQAVENRVFVYLYRNG